jgi:hypothetical protein
MGQRQLRCTAKMCRLSNICAVTAAKRGKSIKNCTLFGHFAEKLGAEKPSGGAFGRAFAPAETKTAPRESETRLSKHSLAPTTSLPIVLVKRLGQSNNAIYVTTPE